MAAQRRVQLAVDPHVDVVRVAASAWTTLSGLGSCMASGHRRRKKRRTETEGEATGSADAVGGTASG